MIVADANLLIALWVGGTQSLLADAVRRRDARWIAPRLWRSEFRNAVLGMTRARILSADRALAVARDIEEAMADDEYDVATHEVLSLALGSGCTAYDCEYVALAEAFDVPLVTFDGEVRRAFPRRAIAPEAFVRD